MIYIVSSSALQCIVNLEGGKLVCNTGKFCHVQELKGGEMVEVQYIMPELTFSHIMYIQYYTQENNAINSFKF